MIKTWSSSSTSALIPKWLISQDVINTIGSNISNDVSIDAKAVTPISLKRVIYSGPATIAFWSDGSKTIVKCHNEAFNKEKGLAMCFAKKVLGNAYRKTFRVWCADSEDTSKEVCHV